MKKQFLVDQLSFSRLAMMELTIHVFLQLGKRTIKAFSTLRQLDISLLPNFDLKMMTDCVSTINPTMEPSFSSLKPKKQVKNKIENRIRVECPNGTVPILKNTKEYVTNAQYWAERHFNPLTDESHGKHIAGVREQGQGPYHGVAAWMTVHDLNISRDQASYANIYAGSVNPSLFGDGQTWRYGFWKGADGAGCYNTICPGFIQVSKTDLLSGPIPHPRKGDRAVFPSIVQEEVSGHWWTAHVRNFKKDIAIGYWPKELFDVIGHSVNMVGVTGAVQASPSGISPPMGNGHLPSKNEDASARVRHLVIVNSKFKGKELDIKTQYDTAHFLYVEFTNLTLNQTRDI
ncbi:hypothetical protein YC2023_123981 [Brassica napus]